MTSVERPLAIVPTAPSTEPLLTVKEVATILNVPFKRVYELDIPAVRIAARSLRWRRSDVQQWIERRIRR